jgi:hypothetical protein
MSALEQVKMISTDGLANLLNNLESSKFLAELNAELNKDSEPKISNLSDLLGEIKEALAALVDSEEYQNWLDREPEFNGVSCPLPPKKKHRDLLKQIGIASDEAMLVKVNLNRGCYLLTDGLWVDQSLRAFPFTDESDALLSYIEQKGLADWADIVIDPCTGSGNHIVAYPGSPVRIAFDVSTRSILYTKINLLINRIHSGVVSHHSLTEGFPTLLKQIDLKKSLFVINTPFALAPTNADMVKTANGGEDGLELTVAAMSLVKEVFHNSSSITGKRALVLCYSTGNGIDKWVAVEKAKEMFGEQNVSWEILSDRKLWRINGQKAEPNPMPLAEGLPKKADCKFYIGNKDKEKVRQSYVGLANRLYQNAVDDKLGYEVTHLGYGIIDIRMD